MAMTKEQKIGVASLGVGVVGLYLFRKSQKTTGGTTTTAVPVSTQGSVGQATFQQPIVLDPHQSVYDPNNESLLTTPSGQTKAPSGPSYVINVIYPRHHPGKRPNRKPQGVVNPATHPGKHPNVQRHRHGRMPNPNDPYLGTRGRKVIGL